MHPPEGGERRAVGCLGAALPAPLANSGDFASAMESEGFVELPAGVSEVSQVMLTLLDDDFAWPVIMRMCRTRGWSLMDPESGRTFGGM